MVDLKGILEGPLLSVRRQLSEEMTLLLRREIAEVKAEISATARVHALAFILFVSVGVLVFLALGLLAVAGIFALQTVVSPWAAALAVGATYGLAALLVAGAANRRLTKVTEPGKAEGLVAGVVEPLCRGRMENDQEDC